MVKGFADFLHSHNDHDTSNEDASNDKADFVKIMVAGIAVMRQPAVPPRLPTTSTITVVGCTTVAVALPSKKKRKFKSGLLMWTNPITGVANCLSLTMSHWYIYYKLHLLNTTVSCASSAYGFDFQITTFRSFQLSLRNEKRFDRGGLVPPTDLANR
ncbi:hypothetical protein MHU86_5888 [Fragilaria crotonensis]|nr:hypothetical protein MHU86_5888 [Fragilaria crotonensis]